MNYDRSILNWLELFFFERLGNKCTLEEDEEGIRMSIIDQEGSIFFKKPSNIFFEASENLPFTWWLAENEGWSVAINDNLPAPGYSSLPNPLIYNVNRTIIVQYDLPGLIYWMLNRIEEFNPKMLDKHGRFNAFEAHAVRFGYLDRPVVDEWIYILRQVIIKNWNNVNLKELNPKTLISCDVDMPFKFSYGLLPIFKRLIFDLYKREKFSKICSSFFSMFSSFLSGQRNDPYFRNIYTIMDINEKSDNKVIFFFLTGGVHYLDKLYNWNSKLLRKLLVDIYNRGHRVGLHPSYLTYKDKSAIFKEAETLKNIMLNEGIFLEQLFSRQHYLRWDPSITPINLEYAQISCDSTLGFADLPGFRCGTCFDFMMFDHINKRELNVRQQPLLVMETTLIEEHYMNMGYDIKLIDVVRKFKDRTRAVGGCFTLLWHNSSFEEEIAYKIYKDIIEL